MNSANPARDQREADAEVPAGQGGESKSGNDLPMLCPNCQKGTLEYDGSLNLVCGHCGYTLSGGGFT